MKIMISQPMRGKSVEQIKAERADVERALMAKGHSVEDSIVTLAPGTKNIPLWCLGYAFQIISDCDAVLFHGRLGRSPRLPHGNGSLQAVRRARYSSGHLTFLSALDCGRKRAAPCLVCLPFPKDCAARTKRGNLAKAKAASRRGGASHPAQRAKRKYPRPHLPNLKPTGRRRMSAWFRHPRYAMAEFKQLSATKAAPALP